ncbi:hypothetical protein CNMCM6936_001671 [Aspergillus lentulus]|uniref:Uncharacterized protein n=1 Tax=Aspergillus lentulus TaxID=293939 RepID=A0AAN5YX81_ASPLE|nr:hypothetical protein CNMCM6936_001671 [Aspergillus lentulus]KAF4207370.1 hypothetical protein CNMCM8927_003113 [Aspergillus lentulus]GFF45340.1 hypothetical protein IFM62136_00230 [Aspergillus lentulus]GFF64483.1 hypothetical protein IFM47457_00704 [Aspergillus lentulus]GFG01146.1 hypothetical protein IFM61392_01665 [Aspergillus lentulus]
MEHLSEAARIVITSLQALPEAPELQRANIAIIGGLALQHHAPGYRPTKDVDILIFDRDHPICTLDVRAKLASRFPNEFEDVPEPVSSCLNIPDTIKVDCIPQELPPYLPADAATLEEVDPNHLPFLPLVDLLVYKINSCGMRPTPEKQKQDAEDAQELVNILSSQGTITLDDSKKQAVVSGLDEMLEYFEEDRDWWESALGLSD